MENEETQGWLDVALACQYIKQDEFELLDLKYEEISRLVVYMMNNPDKFN